MNLNARRIGNIILVLFVIGISISGYLLFQLPVSLTETVAVDEGDLHVITPVLNDVSLIIGFSFVAGIVTILAYIRAINSAENTVKVEYVSIKKEKTAGEEGEDGEDEEINKMEGIPEIKELINKTKSKGQQQTYDAVLSKVCEKLSAVQGAIYLSQLFNDTRVIQLYSSYAFVVPDSQELNYEYGEGLAGQAAKQDKQIIINKVPKGYISIVSGLGSSDPGSLIITPLRHEGTLIGVAEVARFGEFGKQDHAYLQAAFDLLGKTFGHEPHQVEEAPVKPSSDN